MLYFSAVAIFQALVERFAFLDHVNGLQDVGYLFGLNKRLSGPLSREPIQWQPIRPWKTICECGIVGNLLPTFHCQRALSLLPGTLQQSG